MRNGLTNQMENFDKTELLVLTSIWSLEFGLNLHGICGCLQFERALSSTSLNCISEALVPYYPGFYCHLPILGLRLLQTIQFVSDNILVWWIALCCFNFNVVHHWSLLSFYIKYTWKFFDFVVVVLIHNIVFWLIGVMVLLS